MIAPLASCGNQCALWASLPANRMASGSARFARVIELVGSEPEALQAGRRRWRDHLAAGATPHKHEIDAPAQPVTRGAGR